MFFPSISVSLITIFYSYSIYLSKYSKDQNTLTSFTITLVILMFLVTWSSWQRTIFIFCFKTPKTRIVYCLTLLVWEDEGSCRDDIYRYVYQSSLELKICEWSWYCYSKERSFYGLVKHTGSNSRAKFSESQLYCVHKEYSVTRQMRGGKKSF